MKTAISVFCPKANTSCKSLSYIKWLVVKAAKPVTKKLQNELRKANSYTFDGKVLKVHFIDPAKKETVIEILKSQKSNSFEIVEIYDRQFSLSVNYIGKHETKVKSNFITENNGLTTYWCVTEKQYKERIVINN